MRCINCGEPVSPEENICSHCGVEVRDVNEYMEDEDTGSFAPRTRDRRPIRLIALAVAVILVAALTETIYRNYDTNRRQEVTFTVGAGYVNDSQKVVYALFPTVNTVGTIQEAHVYDFDKTKQPDSKTAPVVSEYGYTKSIDGSFRAAFFDISELGLEEGQTYTYTIELVVSFQNASTYHTYDVPIKFKYGNFRDVGEKVFDRTITTTVVTEKNETRHPTTDRD